MARVDSSGSCLTLQNLVRWSGGASGFSPLAPARPVSGVNYDSRLVKPGEVFAALTTEKDDGHRYVAAALKRGAVAALVARKKIDMLGDIDRKKLIVVADPLAALHRIAREYRKTLNFPIVGITGSSGKTTARSFISSVLKRSLTVGETSGNLNNHLGVPLSLLKFTGREDVGVIEMGANHAGEIHLLSSLARPAVGVVTNIGYAHIGFFGSLNATARAKLEITDGMKRRSGFLMLNGDDPLLIRAAGAIEQPVVFFGFSNRCHVRARNCAVVGASQTVFEVDGNAFRLEMPGRHFIYSALLAIHIGRHFGMDNGLIAAALETIKPLPLRGAIERKSGVIFIVDCYNANPSSMKSGIRLLRDIAGNGRMVAIVGDMLELGSHARRLHKALGKQLAEAGVKRIMAVGAFASDVADGAMDGGIPQTNIRTMATGGEALTAAKDFLKQGDVALLKGSRAVGLEKVFEGF